MSRRAVTASLIRYRPARSKNYLDVAALPDGSDLFDRLTKIANAVGTDDLVDQHKQSYTRLEKATPTGRTLLLSLTAGLYGEPGVTRNVDTHKVTHTHGDDEAHTAPLRVLFLVPPRGIAALMFNEFVFGRSAGGKMLNLLRDDWNTTFNEHTLDTETICRTDAWIQQADLQAVSATVYGWSPDLADVGIPKDIGNLTYHLDPPRGSRVFPKALWDRLRMNDVKRSALLGMPAGTEPDEIKVTLGDGNQAKTFLLGKERTPTVRYLLCDNGEPVPDDLEFTTFCADAASELFTNVGVNWQAAWNK